MPSPSADHPLTAPSPEDIERQTDAYFLRTRQIVAKFGDVQATYVVFLRRPVVFTPRLALDWLQGIADARGTAVDIELLHKEGDWVGAGDPLFTYTGSLRHLVDLETQLLQKIGPPCVAAYNAFTMCVDLPKVAFLAMEARHCAGAEMAEMMAYAARVGSDAAKKSMGAKGFVGNATTATAAYYGNERGLGTMPHALVGYAGSTLRAAELYRETFPDDDLVVLVDYFAQEITDALAVCRRFPELAAAGRISFRIDTHGGRFMEGLDQAESYAVLERHAPDSIRGYRTESELRHLVGTGVSAAAIHLLRRKLDDGGFTETRIIASSGFGPAKCKMMAVSNAPVDVIGTGSFLPENWAETYATADIVAYDGKPMVKVGREFLLRKK
jgi:nicotinate phosphoribosyltransferase